VAYIVHPANVLLLSLSLSGILVWDAGLSMTTPAAPCRLAVLGELDEAPLLLLLLLLLDRVVSDCCRTFITSCITEWRRSRPRWLIDKLLESLGGGTAAGLFSFDGEVDNLQLSSASVRE
jgi:hypothetical protein